MINKAHAGDPCYYCNTPHGDVAVGDCPVASRLDEPTQAKIREFEDCEREWCGWDGKHTEDAAGMARSFLSALRDALAAPTT